MHTVATAIIKGGTGKTTTAAAIAQAAAWHGAKVLAVDLDPQANLTFVLGATMNHGGAFEVLQGERSLAEVIQQTPQGVDVLSAHPDLATLRTTTGGAKVLAKALESVKDHYSLCVIDTPPTMGILTYTALAACNRLIIPLEADINSLQGMYQIAEIAHEISRTNENIKHLDALITRYDKRATINKHMMQEILQQAERNGLTPAGVIPYGIAVREAQALQKSLFLHAAKSNPATAYSQLFTRIMEGA